MAELLLELFSEEIPARMQARAAEDLQRLVTDKLKEAGLSWSRAESFASPRRLTLMVDGLPTETPDTVEERKGPRADAPEKAIEGFLKSVGMTRDQVEERDTGKGVVLFAVLQKTGRKTAEVIAESLPAVVHGLPWPKSMRWADGSLRWVRPLQSILGVFDGKALDVAIEGIKVSNQTRGHRFLSPEPFTVKDFADYKAKLQKAYVLLDAQDRKAKIMADAKLLAADAGLSLIEDNALLEEVAGLVEWPVALMGSFDPAFLDVPAEVLTATMRANQKYFSLKTVKAVRPELVEGRAASGFDKPVLSSAPAPSTSSGRTGAPSEGLSPNGDGSALAPNFIVISNMETKDKGRAIIAGNERVLKARLSDAKFFWDQDLKVIREFGLGSLVPKLDGIVFHAKLGSVGDKVKRIIGLSFFIAWRLDEIPDSIIEPAKLSKADLVTGMVGEFPELQGIMGSYYAAFEGKSSDIATAIREHYSPLGPSDNCPTNKLSVVVALADKIDSLCAFYSIGEKPTGSKDPFALRRAALGVARLIVENKLRLKLREVLGVSLAKQIRFKDVEPGWSQKNLIPKEVEVAKLVSEQILSDILSELMSFFADRLKVQQREKGVRHDLIDAVFSLGGEDDLVRLIDRVQALQQMLATEDGATLLSAYRRGSNIVTIEEKKDKRAYTGGVIGDQLTAPEEKALYQKLQDVKARVAAAVNQERWIEAMTAVATLRGPIDAFFDKVTVNDADATLRENRLNLLAEFRATLSAVADFSKIEG